MSVTGWGGDYHLASFQAEVTAPIGHALMGGGIAPASEVVDPLYCKGVVLLGSDKPFVVASIDWCEIRNAAYDRWREALANAAGTDRERVFFSCIHQHDTPVADLEAQRLLDQAGLEQSLCDVAFHEDCVQRVSEALKAALKNPMVITHYGIGQANVDKVASNRRVLLPGGKVGFPRNSATLDPEVRAADVGTIDPYLKTLSFWNGEKPVAGLSFYAVHPMSYYGKGGVSYDFVGMAREKLQRERPEVFQMYLSGCSGDVTAGKFNDGSPENRPVLADRIYDAMKKSWDATKTYPIESLDFRWVDLKLPVRSSSGFTEEAMTQRLNDPEQTTFQRNLAAMGLAWKKRVDSGQPIDVSCLDFGKAQFLLMPAESFVQYQLEAQKMRPDSFVVVAGYGECGPGYIPSFEATREGFIDAHIWCWVDPGSDRPMIEAMREALDAH
ncbi:MAG: hypothetical protein KC964_05230 [Candidatus Omnitrophica bacterium]|nr:hypothetical protein [Candidatus Omnitrophota bacterium]